MEKEQVIKELRETVEKLKQLYLEAEHHNLKVMLILQNVSFYNSQFEPRSRTPSSREAKIEVDIEEVIKY